MWFPRTLSPPTVTEAPGAGWKITRGPEGLEPVSDCPP